MLCSQKNRAIPILNRWQPDLRCESVFALPWTFFREQKKLTLLFDLDNTLGPWGVKRLDPEALDLLQTLKGTGFSVGVLSNSRLSNRKTALKQQLSPLEIPLVYDARKPAAAGYRELIEALSGSPQRAVMVGDQLFTDIWGAKRLGIMAVLVDPFDPQSEPLWASLRRPLERLLTTLSKLG